MLLHFKDMEKSSNLTLPPRLLPITLRAPDPRISCSQATVNNLKVEQSMYVHSYVTWRLTKEMHATGITWSASRTLITRSAFTLAPTYCSEIFTTGGDDRLMFRFISWFGYFLYSCGMMNLHLAVFRRSWPGTLSTIHCINSAWMNIEWLNISYEKWSIDEYHQYHTL